MKPKFQPTFEDRNHWDV